MARKAGSLGGEMRMRISSHCEKKSNKTRWNYIKACGNFDKWRKSVGISNRIVREDSKAAIEKWRDALQSEGYAASTIHTYIADVCCGLGIDMTGIVCHGTSEDKSKSLGRSERSRAAREKLSNERIVDSRRWLGRAEERWGASPGRNCLLIRATVCVFCYHGSR